jgi:hypothetical protein
MKALAPLAMLAALPAAAGDITFGTGFDYSSGKYGGSQSTEISYVPVTAKYESGASTVKLTLPWLSIRTPGNGALIGVDASGRPIYDGNGAKTTAEGQGDVVLAYSHSLFMTPRNGFLLDLTGKIKFATADANKGLGTGKNDYTALADIYYLADAWTPFATVSYRVTGDPAGSNLRNVWGGTLGLGYKQSKSDSLGLMWDSRQASSATGRASSEATAYWVHKFGDGLKLQTYAIKGFSDGSPDWGAGVMVSKLF